MKTVISKINTPFIHRYGMMALSLILGIVTCAFVV